MAKKYTYSVVLHESYAGLKQFKSLPKARAYGRAIANITGKIVDIHRKRRK